MVDVQLHPRGEQPELRHLSAVPTVGTYIHGPGAERRLWRVEDVVFDRETIHVYTTEVSAELTAELQAAWSAWGEPQSQGDEGGT